MRLLLALIALLAAQPAAAVERALLVGASEFIDPRLQGETLPGAAADVARMGEALRRIGLPGQEISTLVGRQATLAAVRARLDGLARDSRPGDRVVLFLSGHGTQAPAAPGDTSEPDGMDEMFLLADAGRWDGAAHRLPGALSDNELGARLAALRAAGVDLWLVVDSCTSGGLTRSGARPRRILPAALGIPETPRRALADLSGLADPGAPAGGRLVVFSAAPAGAVAWETGTGGAFTNALVDALGGADRPATFHQLAARIDATERPLATPRTPIWVAGDLAAPFLFDGAAEDLRTLAARLPAIEGAIDVTLAAGGPPCPTRAASSRQFGPVDAIGPDHCDRVEVVIAPSAPILVDAWYRDAAGRYASLSPPAGLRGDRTRPARIGFLFVTRDPVTGTALPVGEEALLLIARGQDGRPAAARTLRILPGS